jgi:hypothetical protein
VPVFFGRHRIEAGGKAADVELLKKDGSKTVSLAAP